MVGGEGGKGPVPEPTYPKRQLTENSASLRGNNESGILYRDPENTCSVVGQRAENHERDRPTTRHVPQGRDVTGGRGGKEEGGNAVSINQRVRPRFTGVARSFYPGNWNSIRERAISAWKSSTDTFLALPFL